MSTYIVTGSAGLVGYSVAVRLGTRGHLVIGIDNDMRGQLFGPEASTHHNVDRLLQVLGDSYVHLSGDIRSRDTLTALKMYTDLSDIHGVIHCASQPSHDWAAKSPLVDFDINARATLQMLEWLSVVRPSAWFIYMSTNKVYGDRINTYKFMEKETRYEIEPGQYVTLDGVDEDMAVDGSLHSLFGISKLSGDLLVQEYGRYFGLPTVCLRCGCLTGKGHKGARQHGFLSYLAKCIKHGEPYTIIGYKGKQVRDNLHAEDVASAVMCLLDGPSRFGEVYNLGGGRVNSISILEAIEALEKAIGKKATIRYHRPPRIGDHRWWITNTQRFRHDYPLWSMRWHLPEIIEELARG